MCKKWQKSHAKCRLDAKCNDNLHFLHREKNFQGKFGKNVSKFRKMRKIMGKIASKAKRDEK